MCRLRLGSRVFLLATLLVDSGWLWSEQSVSGQALCDSAEILSSPNRPNLASSADVTECGLLELEQGWTRLNENDGDHEDFLNSTLRYGLGHNLDVRWGADLMAHDSEPAERKTGVGDTGVAIRYQFRKQSTVVPAMTVQYGTKLPSAEAHLGSGFTDHNLGFLASKDFGAVHLDYNLIHAWLGRPSGYGSYTYMVLALSRTLHNGFGGILEFSGDVKPLGCPIASPALTYKVNRRLTFDAGMNFALRSGPVRNRVLFGFTYALWKHVGSSQH